MALFFRSPLFGSPLYLDNDLHFFTLRIERKLRTQQYKNYIEFASDMRQMFTETYKYNNPDSPMVTAAGKLQKEFEVRFAKINFDERKPVRPGNHGSFLTYVSPVLPDLGICCKFGYFYFANIYQNRLLAVFQFWLLC